MIPVVVFLLALGFVDGRFFQVLGSRKLARGCVGRAMLDGGMSITKVSKVVDISRAQERSRGERMDGSIAPLADRQQASISSSALTLSIQKPPLRSIMVKKSSYSLLRNQSSRAISKLLQK